MLLLLLAAVLGEDTLCPACGFWLDPRYGHVCVPC